jgi:transposase
MFLRRNRRSIRGEDYEYWTLVESVRTKRGPRQRIVATLGKYPGLNKEERIGWEEIQRILNGSPKTTNLFKEEADVPEWAMVDIRGVKVERLRQFGDIYLALILWKKLKLDEIFTKLQLQGKEDIEWDIMFCVLTLARFCNPSSELEIAESWYEKTPLEDLLGVPMYKINEDRLYRALDQILPHKELVCRHLQERYTNWFNVRYDFLFYDVTSTYFEGQCKQNPQAKRGYSRDKRADCVQICIGLVVTLEGLPIGYEVFDGNRNDVTTLEDIVKLMEKKYGKAHRVWVFDRGIVSEANLAYLNECKAQYVVGTPKYLLKKFEAVLCDKSWDEVESGVEVKIVTHPDYGEEKFVLCRSRQREQKEQAILDRQIQLLESQLQKIQKSIRNGRLKDSLVAERRIGRWLGRYVKVERLFELELVRQDDHLIDLKITRRIERLAWVQKVHGYYLLRTNLNEEDPRKLWKIYMQLNQAETAFRMSKSNLGMRPIFHHKEQRVQAHIFVCFLALAMYKSLELWMASKGLGNGPQKLLREFKEIRSMDVVLPVKDRNPIRLRVVGRPDKHVQILLYKLGIKIPNRPKIMQNVVENLIPDFS